MSGQAKPATSPTKGADRFSAEIGRRALLKVGLGLMLAPAALGFTGQSQTAHAQQVAVNAPDYSACKPLMNSDNVRAYPDCMVRTLQEHTRALQAHTREVEADTACSNELVTRGRADPAFVQRGRVILAGKRLREFGACNLLRALTQG